jgi:hypothetical protein
MQSCRNWELLAEGRQTGVSTLETVLPDSFQSYSRTIQGHPFVEMWTPPHQKTF